MDGTANPSFSPDIASTGPSPQPELRQRIPRNLSTGKFEEDDGMFYRSTWAGMDQYEVDVRSSHTVWRVARWVLLASLGIVWAAMLIACIVLLARGPTADTVCSDAGHWYDTAISYQIAPSSFQDSNGDGFGDIKGIISRLDYLKYLGVDAIWLGPIFESSGMNLWMDVTNFTAIDGLYGTLQDLEELVSTVHNKSMKLILEFIPNHSSDQHPWFEQSRQSDDNAYSDYYIWAGGLNDGPPTEMLSTEGSSAWEYDSNRQQWYLHTFMKEQPDLNYRSPKVVRDIQAALSFWLDKGVDGFYMRHTDRIFEAVMMMNSSGSDNGGSVTASGDMPEPNMHILDVVAGWRQLLDEHKSSNIGAPGRVNERSKLLVVDVGKDLGLAAMIYSNTSLGVEVKRAGYPFNFMFLDVSQPLNGHHLRAAIEDWIAAGPASVSRNWAVGMTDVSRIASRIGAHFSKALLFLILMLPGSPVIYYGDEIGMVDGVKVNVSSDDPVTTMMDLDRELTRLPMQWSADRNAGFTDASSEPWIPVDVNASQVNVQIQRQVNTSHLAFIQQTIQFRRGNPKLFGIHAFRPHATFKEIFAFTRHSATSDGGTPLAVFAAINVGNYGVTEDFKNSAEGIPMDGMVVVASDQTRIGQTVEFSSIFLRSGEAIVLLYTPLTSL